MKSRYSVPILAVAVLCAASVVQAQQRTPGSLLSRRTGAGATAPAASGANAAAKAQEMKAGSNPEHPNDGKLESGGCSIEFNGAPLEMVLKVYSELKNMTVLKDPGATCANITLQPLKGQELTDAEKIVAVEAVLEMNGIHIEPYGESGKFLRAVARKDARKEGIPLLLDPSTELDDSTKVVSLMFTFKNIAVEEAKTALEGFKSASGVLNVFERTNAILVTDTSVNVQRMRKLAEVIDIPPQRPEKLFYRQIKLAAVQDVYTILTKVIEENKKLLESKGKRPSGGATAAAPTPISTGSRFLKQNGSQASASSAGNASAVTAMSDADRGMLVGDTIIIADERSNKLLIQTIPSNMPRFNEIIDQLDIETEAEWEYPVWRLKYAEAKDVADMVNDLLDNNKSSSQTKKSANANSNSAKPAATPAAAKAGGDASETRKLLNRDNVPAVLADERINGLVVKVRKEVMKELKSVIDSMDVKLSQVLIETVIIEVTLGNDLNAGIDWVNKQFTGKDPQVRGGGGGGTTADTLREIIGGTTSKSFSDLAKEAKSVLGDNITMSQIEDYIQAAREQEAVGGTVTPIGAGVTYFLKSDKLNLTAVISAAKSDSRAKYIASPVVMTVDNKEAQIEATEARKFFNGYETSSSYSTYVRTPKYDSKDIGITIKVKPKINPNGTVMLNVEEDYSQLGAGQSILVDDGMATIDTALTRKMSADILLENGQSVVLGGLTETYTSERQTGIPILKDIPWVGKWIFGSVVQSESRKELLVFMTPYVLTDAEAAEIEAARRKDALSDQRAWDDHGWSASKLADPVSKKEQLRRLENKWKIQDEELSSAEAIDEAKKERAKKLEELAAEKARAEAKEREKREDKPKSE